jgi:thiamine-monophosphate kinase
METKRREIAEIGEFGLIELIRRLCDVPLPEDPGVRQRLVKGIGDDAAVFRPSPGSVELVSVDTLVEGIHFDLATTSFSHLGSKAAAVSLSDIAAMGGVPRYLLIALSIPASISVGMIEEFYKGVRHICKSYSCLVAGGDTTASHTTFSVSVTAIGEAAESRVVYRKGAKEGDYLCVTGHLGASVAGLKILQREKRRLIEARGAGEYRPELAPYKPAIEKHLLPKPRLDISAILTDRVQVHSMIDISDGLASEVRHLCSQSDVGASVFEHNLPIDPLTGRIAAEFSESPTGYALYGGEEYELLFTLGEQEFETLGRLTDDVTIIGRITKSDEGIVLVREQGERETLAAGGWDHFISTRKGESV